jgi:hypothetical protein
MKQLMFEGWETIPQFVRRPAAEVLGIEEPTGGLQALWPELLRRLRERPQDAGSRIGCSWTSMGFWRNDDYAGGGGLSARVVLAEGTDVIRSEEG